MTSVQTRFLPKVKHCFLPTTFEYFPTKTRTCTRRYVLSSKLRLLGKWIRSFSFSSSPILSFYRRAFEFPHASLPLLINTTLPLFLSLTQQFHTISQSSSSFQLIKTFLNMVDFDWKSNMVASDMSTKSPKRPTKPHISIPPPVRTGDLSPASSTSCAAYEQYIRLPELSKLWNTKQFPTWKNESLIKPALQGLEITFRFVSIVLSDPRPYVNRNEWKRRLESFATHQIELIALLCEDDSQDPDTRGTAPIVGLSTSDGVLETKGSEVWKIPGASHVVSKTSASSLLPRLAAWQKSEDLASKICFSIECEFRRCPYTLSLGEPNLSGKPNLEYDLVCRPSDLHSLKQNNDHKKLQNYENQSLFTIHQILESWVRVSRELIDRIEDEINKRDFEKASNSSWLLERIWKLLAEIEDLHLLMDPDDFLRLKSQLAIKASTETEEFCFRSKNLIEITRLSKDLRHKVPSILNVEVDPKGAPRVQEAAMKLYRYHPKEGVEKIHLLQAFQAIESAVKRFFFSYRQLIVILMGSLEATGNRHFVSADSDDTLLQIFSEPTYFPSLDAAKTFVGLEHQHQTTRNG